MEPAEEKRHASTRKPSEATRQRVWVKSHIPPPRQSQEAHVRLQEMQAPPLQHQPPRKQPDADAPLHPPNGEGPKQVPLGPTSSPVGQTDQVQTERLPEPPQEPRQSPAQSEDPPGNPHAQTSGESQPPGRPKGPQHEEHRNRPLRGPQHHWKHVQVRP
ncbi:acidic proline-rich protein PRP25-like [Procambarus clarkii]|uniref:acidic proline-rich protein PRP25-like n=1 Tax=Procambarus clarkii TaxID=6728 RepID=UPI003743254C